jgi:hypothetical protein
MSEPVYVGFDDGLPTDFHEYVQAAAARIPPALQAALSAARVKVWGVGRIIERWPVYAERTPRGYDGGGYEFCSATYWPEQGWCIIADEFVCNRSRQWSKERDPWAVVHELGHGFDERVCGDDSQRPAFRAAHAAEAARLHAHAPEGIRTMLAYFTQPDGAGASELYAEAFALPFVHTPFAALLREWFPACVEHVHARVQQAATPQPMEAAA